jgi:hypothetical protein
MGDAKRREQSGERMGSSDLDKKQALQDELWRIERQRNGEALQERWFGVIPQEARPKGVRNG